MDMLDHTAGNLTASSAIIADSNSQIDELQIKNQGRLKLLEQTANGTNRIDIRAPAAVTNDTILTLPDGAGSNGQALTTNGSGVLSWTTIASSFTLSLIHI